MDLNSAKIYLEPRKVYLNLRKWLNSEFHVHIVHIDFLKFRHNFKYSFTVYYSDPFFLIIVSNSIIIIQCFFQPNMRPEKIFYIQGKNVECLLLVRLTSDTSKIHAEGVRNERTIV